MIIDSLTRVQRATPEGLGTVIGLHHTRKDGRTSRGSSALEDAVDAVYQSLINEDDMSVILTNTKRKDGPHTGFHELRLSRVEGTKSCVVEKHSTAPSLTGDPMKTAANADKLIRLLNGQLRLWRYKGVSWTALFKAADEECAMSQSSFSYALAAAVEAGQIVVSGNKRKLYHLPNMTTHDESDEPSADQ